MYPYIQAYLGIISSYQISLVCAFSLGVCLAVTLSPPLSFSLNITAIMLLPIFFTALLGAKLIFVLLESGDIRDITKIWRGGYYYHGGLVGGITGYTGYLWITGNPVKDGLDWVAPFAALGEAVGRCGCFLAGCCYGTVTHGFTAVLYPANSPAWRHHINMGYLRESSLSSLPVHPTPLYAVLAMLILYVFLRRLQIKRRFPGIVALHFLFWQSLARIGVEYFRDDMSRHACGWTTTQITAAIITIAVAAVMINKYNPQRSHNARRWQRTGHTKEELS